MTQALVAPERFAVVDEDAALALAGPEPEAFRAEGAIGRTGVAGTVFVADFVDTPYRSGLWGRRRFVVHAPVWTERPTGPGSRVTSWLDPRDRRAVHLFIRVPEGCLYVGTGRLSENLFRDDFTVGLCSFDVETVEFEGIPFAEPPEPPRPPQPCTPDWIDHLPDDPTAALRDFITGWYPETDPVPSEPVDYAGVPASLVEFYRLAETRPQILGWHSTIEPSATWHGADLRSRRCFGSGWDSFMCSAKPSSARSPNLAPAA